MSKLGGRASAPSACIPSYRRASAFPLSWPSRRHRWRGIGVALPTRRAQPRDAAVRARSLRWHAPAGFGRFPCMSDQRLRIVLSQCDTRRKPSSIRGLSDLDGNSSYTTVIRRELCRVFCAAWPIDGSPSKAASDSFSATTDGTMDFGHCSSFASLSLRVRTGRAVGRPALDETSLYRHGRAVQQARPSVAAECH
jgi:hypothetical protein